MNIVLEGGRDMKQSFKMKYRSVISVVLALFIASALVGLSYKSWYSKNINVSFNAVNTRNVTYKLFYAVDANDDLVDERSVTKYVKTGATDVKIIIPANKLSKFRLDFGLQPGVVNISKLKINGHVKVKLDDFASYKVENIDGSELKDDGSITIVSDQVDPYMLVNKVFNIYPGYDIDWIKLSLFFGVIFVIFYAFFMLALYEKKKKRKEFYDYY